MNRLQTREPGESALVRARRNGGERGAPEDLHVHVRLEDDEEVRVVVRVHLGARVAQVLRAVRAVEPLADDVGHATIAYCGFVDNVAEVLCIDGMGWDSLVKKAMAEVRL